MPRLKKTRPCSEKLALKLIETARGALKGLEIRAKEFKIVRKTVSLSLRIYSMAREVADARLDCLQRRNLALEIDIHDIGTGRSDFQNQL
jgi:hypothetical protein